MASGLERRLLHEDIGETFAWLRQNPQWNEALWFRAVIRRVLAANSPGGDEPDVLMGLRGIGRFHLAMTGPYALTATASVEEAAAFFYDRNDPVLVWLGSRPGDKLDFGAVFPRQSAAWAALVGEAQREIALDASWALRALTPIAVLKQPYSNLPGRPLQRKGMSQELEVAWGRMANHLAGGILLETALDRHSLEALCGGSREDWPPKVSAAQASLRALGRFEQASGQYVVPIKLRSHLSEIPLHNLVSELTLSGLATDYSTAIPLPTNHGSDYSRYFHLLDEVTAKRIRPADVEEMFDRRMRGEPAFRYVGLGPRKPSWQTNLDEWLAPSSPIDLLQMLRAYPPDPVAHDEEPPNDAKVPAPTDRAPRLTRAVDGRFDIMPTSAGSDFDSIRDALREEIEEVLPGFGSHQNAHPEVFTHLTRYAASLTANNIWRIWTAGNALRHDVETDGRRVRDRDPDRPAMPHGLSGFVRQVVDGHNAMMEFHEIGRKLDAARPSPIQRREALDAVSRMGPTLEALRESPQVFTENTISVISEIVANAQQTSPDGLTTEQAALLAVDTLNNSQQAVLQDTEEALNRLAPSDLQQLRYIVADIQKRVAGDLKPTARRQFWPAFFAALGEQLATWTVRASVVSIGFVAFNAQQIMAWLATGAETAGLRAAAIDLLTKLGITF